MVLEDSFVHLARLALTGRQQDVQAYLYRVMKESRKTDSGLAENLEALIRESPSRSSPLRKSSEIAVPVDADSRLQLLRVDEAPYLDREPTFSGPLSLALSRLVKERAEESRLLKLDLQPTRSVLFTGPPGVGKTMSARWLAREMGRPLLVLDLAAVMSSFLGRTGANLRHVLDYAKAQDCVLLLDELDAIAKRRDDTGEVGELKRLVTVLLQEIDDWPTGGLLIAATNHAGLLDPAIWRRFELILDFPLPSGELVSQFVGDQLDGFVKDNAGEWVKILSVLFQGRSFSEIEREMNAAKRAAVLDAVSPDDALSSMLGAGELEQQDRIGLAVKLVGMGVVSQRRAHELTGVARETIRSRLKQSGKAKQVA